MANILCLSEKTENVVDIVNIFIKKYYPEERHVRRVFMYE